VVAFVHNSWLDPNKIRRTTIVGTKKMLVYDDIEPQEKIKIYDKGVDVPPYYDTMRNSTFLIGMGHSQPEDRRLRTLKRECEHYLTCIRKGDAPRSDGYSGLRVVSILEAANKSLRKKGRAVPVQGMRILAQKSKNNGNGWH